MRVIRVRSVASEPTVTRGVTRTCDDLGVAHQPAPVDVGDVLKLGHGRLRIEESDSRRAG